MELKSVMAQVAINAIYAAYGQKVLIKTETGNLSKEREEVGNYRFVQFIGRAKQVRLSSITRSHIETALETNPMKK